MATFQIEHEKLEGFSLVATTGKNAIKVSGSVPEILTCEQAKALQRILNTAVKKAGGEEKSRTIVLHARKPKAS
jgi:hypothetical protein